MLIHLKDKVHFLFISEKKSVLFKNFCYKGLCSLLEESFFLNHSLPLMLLTLGFPLNPVAPGSQPFLFNIPFFYTSLKLLLIMYSPWEPHELP